MDELLDLKNQTEIAVYRDGKLMLVDTRETRFFEAWRGMDDAIIPARCVRTLTKAIFGQRFYYRYWTWPQSQGLYGFYDSCRIKPAKDYHFDGLSALSDLFASETYDTIRFRPISAFSEVAKYPPELFKITDEACSYGDWEKGYLLALIRFGDTVPGSSASARTIGKYSSDLEFVKRYACEGEKGRRGMVAVLTAFAWAYDAFSVPLRYFSAQSALGFSRECLGYSGNDLATFRRVFFKGGNSKDGHGLMLDPAKPFIVRQWPERPAPIILNSQAAAHHGFDTQLVANALEKSFARRVLIR
jgi:hypothetical protein